MSPEPVQKILPEVIAMFQKTNKIISEIEIQPLGTYRVAVSGNSICLENEV